MSLVSDVRLFVSQQRSAYASDRDRGQQERPGPLKVSSAAQCQGIMVWSRQVSVEEGEILCTEYSEMTTSYYGEISVAEQNVTQLFVDLYRWVKKHKVVPKPMTPSLLDRVVIGIKGSTSNGSVIG